MLVGGDEDDERGAGAVLPQLGQAHAIDAGHVDVEEDQRDGVILGGLDQLLGLRGGRRRDL